MRNIIRKKRILEAALADFDETDPRKSFNSVLKYGYNIINKLNKAENDTAQKILYALTEYIKFATKINDYFIEKDRFIQHKFDHVALKMTKEEFKTKLKQLYQFTPTTLMKKQEELFYIIVDFTNNLEINYDTVSAVHLKVEPFSAQQENVFKTTFSNYSKQKETTFTT